MNQKIEIGSPKSTDQDEALKKPTIMENEYFQVATRMVATSVGVASVLYPLDVYKTRLQVDAKSSKVTMGVAGSSPFMWSYRVVAPFVSGFINANKSSLIKNSVLSNRETVSTSVDALIAEKKIEQNALKKHQGLLLTTGVIAGLDTTFTQYYSNIRVLNSLGERPVLSMLDKLAFAKEGALIRGSRNYLTTLACIGANALLSNQLTPYLPRSTNAFAHDATTSILAGFAIAPFINALDVIYKNKIKQIDMETLKTPGVGKVISTLWDKGKFAPFTRGSATTGVYTALAFMTINGISVLLDKYVFPPTESLVESPVKNKVNRNAFFAPAPAPIKTIEATAEADVALQESPSPRS